MSTRFIEVRVREDRMTFNVDVIECVTKQDDQTYIVFKDGKPSLQVEDTYEVLQMKLKAV